MGAVMGSAAGAVAGAEIGMTVEDALSSTGEMDDSDAVGRAQRGKCTGDMVGAATGCVLGGLVGAEIESDFKRTDLEL